MDNSCSVPVDIWQYLERCFWSSLLGEIGTGIWWVEARDAAKSLQCIVHSIFPTSKTKQNTRRNYLAPNGISTESEQLCQKLQDEKELTVRIDVIKFFLEEDYLGGLRFWNLKSWQRWSETLLRCTGKKAAGPHLWSGAIDFELEMGRKYSTGQQ